MTIKSLEELKGLRDKHKAELVNRDSENPESKFRITVGMATCGIASGSRDTINAIIDELKNQNINNVTVVQSGCMGLCYAEPTIEVREPGKNSVIYGNVDPERGREIVNKHIKEGNPIKEWEIKRQFNSI
jgi:NADP-reducing hydrogenase subunit HndB